MNVFLLGLLINQLINSKNIFIPNLKCFPIWVIAGGDKQIVGLVLAVAVTKQHIAVFFLLFFFFIIFIKQNNALRFADEEDKDGFPQLKWVNNNQHVNVNYVKCKLLLNILVYHLIFYIFVICKKLRLGKNQ